MFLFNFIDYYLLIIQYYTEVEYDAKQDEKEQHKAKMKEVDQIENLQKDKEDIGKIYYYFIFLFPFLFCLLLKKIQIKSKKQMIHSVHE